MSHIDAGTYHLTQGDTPTLVVRVADGPQAQQVSAVQFALADLRKDESVMVLEDGAGHLVVRVPLSEADTSGLSAPGSHRGQLRIEADGLGLTVADFRVVVTSRLTVSPDEEGV